MTFDRRSFLKYSGALGLGGALQQPMAALAQGAKTPIKLTLPWLPLGTFSYAFVAKKMGFFDKRGLDVTIDRGFGSGRVCVPVDQGQYDFGILDLSVMMNCAGRGLDLVAVAGIWPRSPVGIFSLKESNITKPKDLEGQTVAFDVGRGNFFGSIAPSLWAQNLEINGILYEDYGVKCYSNVVACKASTIEKRPDVCKAFVEGLMEGL